MKEPEIHKETRHIMINSPQIRHYVFNTIKTAKYNWLTFIPLATIYQFNNYFNIFFLLSAIIMAIKEISPSDPGIALAPFIFVISVSVVREGIEDWKKSKYDKTYNHSITTKVSFANNEEEKVMWSRLKVGDVLKINKNESIPADLLVIKSSLSSGFCYMETTNLDGESALKPREAVPIFNQILRAPEGKTELEIHKLKGEIEVDHPNCNIYTVNGSVTLTNTETNETSAKTFFDINNVLLRGTTLKNVEFSYGLVLYTGIDTKIMKNIQHFSLKNSSIEKTLNKVIIVVIIIVFSICGACTSFGMIFMGANVPSTEQGLRRSEYIYYASSADYPYTLEFFKLFGAFFIIFNNIIPISLTITFEIAKGIQIFLMSSDKQMFNESQGENFKVLSMKLQEDLGNVKYIFTDKTGTLTKNEMIFRACSIYSKLFFDNDESNEENEFASSAVTGSNKKSIFSPLFNLNSITNALNCDLPIELDDVEYSYYKSTRDSVIEFFLNISINHNVLTEVDHVSGKTFYQGANPDEVALVTAAKEIGIEFVKREGSLITIKIDNIDYTYEVLHKFEFSSERARSSIIIRDIQNEEIKLFIKGSDDKILKILDNFSKKNLEINTKEHLDKFAKSGLRTLCYAVKVISEEEYAEWNKTFNEIKYQCLIDKEKKKELEEEIIKIESDCILLGVSGLEDKLQDDVRGTITQLIEAGIQMWMVTGDKLDTAESIGYSSKFFDEDSEVFKIKNASEKKEILENMKIILEEIDNIEKQLNKTKLERKKKKKKVKEIKENKEFKEINDYAIFDKNTINIDNIMNVGDKNTNDGNLASIDDYLTIENFKYTPRIINSDCNNNDSPEIRLKSCKTHQDSNRNNATYANYANYAISSQRNNLSSRRCLYPKKFAKTSDFKEHDNLNNNPNDNMNTRSNNNMNTPHPNNNIRRHSKINPPDLYIDNINSSIVDDVSVFKFMMDKNFFDTSIMNKNEFAHTFMNKVLQCANSNNKSLSNFQKTLPKDKEHENPISIRINDRNNIEIINSEQPFKAKTSEEEYEEIDLTNLYDHYLQELNRMQERKNSVRKILKFTNFDFHNFRKKKSEEEEHDMKDVNLLNFGLVIEGNAITHCLDDELKSTFWKLIKKSRAIICCRCTPIQKSDIVNFVKSKSGEVCLSIGDGGNDVNMIKAANVGIGIFGKEGYQAAFNSDYAISQFKYLKRLLFYHGRYSLLRNSYFIYFFFYKSLIFNVPNLWFAFFSGFSGTLLWDSMYFMLYTSILSTVPPCVVMVFEEDIDITFEDDPNREVLINLVPDIYKEYRDSSPFNSLKFFIIFLLGIIHSGVIYFFPLFVFRFGFQDCTGRAHTLWDQSLLGTLTIFFVQYYIIFQDTFLYSLPVIACHTCQILVIVIFFALYALFGDDQLGAYTFDIISNLQFWLVMIITLVIDLLFVIVSRKADIYLSDNIINNLRNRKYEHDYTKKLYIKKLEHMSKCTRSLAKFKKIYKEIDKYEANTYADRKMKDFVEMYLKNKKDGEKNKLNNLVDKKSSCQFLKSRSLENFTEKLKTLNIKIKNITSNKGKSNKNVRDIVNGPFKNHLAMTNFKNCLNNKDLYSSNDSIKSYNLKNKSEIHEENTQNEFSIEKENVHFNLNNKSTSVKFKARSSNNLTELNISPQKNCDLARGVGNEIVYNIKTRVIYFDDKKEKFFEDEGKEIEKEEVYEEDKHSDNNKIL